MTPLIFNLQSSIFMILSLLLLLLLEYPLQYTHSITLTHQQISCYCLDILDQFPSLAACYKSTRKPRQGSLTEDVRHATRSIAIFGDYTGGERHHLLKYTTLLQGTRF